MTSCSRASLEACTPSRKRDYLNLICINCTSLNHHCSPLSILPDLHLLDRGAPVELLGLLPKPGLHVAPYVDEAALDNLEFAATLLLELFPLRRVLLLDAFHLLLVLCHQQLRPVEELLLRREHMPFLLALLERLDLLPDLLGFLVEALQPEDLALLLEVQNLAREMDHLGFTLALDRFSEELQLVLVPLLQLDLEQRCLVLEVGNDHVVPLVD